MDTERAEETMNEGLSEEEKRAGRALLKYSRHQVQMHDFSFPDPAPVT